MNQITSDLSSCTDPNARDTYIGHVDDCPGGTVQVTSDVPTATETCVTWDNVQTANAGHKITGGTRYSTCGSFVQAKFDNLKTALDDYYDKMKDTATAPSTGQTSPLDGTIDAGFTAHVHAPEFAFHANLKDAADKLSTLDSDIADSLAFMTSLTGNFYGSLNCTIFRRELKIVQNMICFKFTLNFARVAYVIGLTGPFMFMFSLCLCCSIRCGIKHKDSNKKEKPKPNQVLQDPEAKNAGANLPSEQMDMMPIANKTGPVGAGQGAPQHKMGMLPPVQTYY